MDWFRTRAAALGVEHAPPKPILMGRHLLDLGLQPGPQLGVLLKEIYERQLDGEIQTLDEAIAAARQQLSTSHG
jgi:tRNA nucleotidyltransferase (CCA-adding enzyme)